MNKIQAKLTRTRVFGEGGLATRCLTLGEKELEKMIEVFEAKGLQTNKLKSLLNGEKEEFDYTILSYPLNVEALVFTHSYLMNVGKVEFDENLQIELKQKTK